MEGRVKLTEMIPYGSIGAEIGVQRGLFSYTLCSTGKFNKFYSIDWWNDEWDDVKFVSNGRVNSKIPDEEFEEWKKDFGGYETNDELFQTTCDRLKEFEFSEVIRKKSVEAAGLFEDNSLDFVYIDSSHDYNSVMEDLINWLPKVKKGGIFAGDDYTDKCDFYNFGEKQVRCLIEVKSAVDEFLPNAKILELKKDAPQWYIKVE